MILTVMALLVAGHARAAPGASLWAHYQQHDYFALRDALPPPNARDSQSIQFLRAATLAAFGKTDASIKILVQLTSRSIESRSLEIDARELLMLDLRTKFQYAAALRAIAPLIDMRRSNDDPRMRDLRNRAGLLRAIIDAPPQYAIGGSGKPLAREPDGTADVKINGSAERMQIDTGANISVISRSAAIALGLKIRPANYAIASSLGGTVNADAAVADLAFADGAQVANAILLVLPDRAMKSSGERRVAGLIGLPVIAGLGGLVFSGRQVRLSPPSQDKGAFTALALSGGDPLLRALYRGRSILCRIDTGADRSIFYAPFFQQFREDFTHARRRIVRIGGAAGTRRLKVVEAPAITISLAGRGLELRNAVVLTDPILSARARGLFCNIGRDVLDRLPSWGMDFRRMVFAAGDEKAGR